MNIKANQLKKENDYTDAYVKWLQTPGYKRGPPPKK